MISLKGKLETAGITRPNRHERRRLEAGYLPPSPVVVEAPRKPGEKRVFKISKEQMALRSK